MAFQGMSPERVTLTGRYVREMCGNHPVKGLFREQPGLQRLFGRCFNTSAESAPEKLVGIMDLVGKRTG